MVIVAHHPSLVVFLTVTAALANTILGSMSGPAKVTSRCGHPGLPAGARLANVEADRIRFDDGQQVKYNCQLNFQTHGQTRTCVKGRWKGPEARCGKPMENEIVFIQVKKCGEETRAKNKKRIKRNYSREVLVKTSTSKTPTRGFDRTTVKSSSTVLPKTRYVQEATSQRPVLSKHEVTSGVVYEKEEGSVNETRHENDEEFVDEANSKSDDQSQETDPDVLLSMEINQTSNPLRIFNAFHASRSSGPIFVDGSDCFLWTMKVRRPTMMPFITIDLATRLTDEEARSPDILTNASLILAEPQVSAHRKCRLANSANHLNPDLETNSTFFLTVFHFHCDSPSEAAFVAESKNLSDTITVRTSVGRPRDLHLVAIFLAGHYTNAATGRPDCGKPETRQTGVNGRESNFVNQMKYQCNETFDDITDGQPSGGPNKWYSVNCTVNGVWTGQFPKCRPKVACPGIHELEHTKDPSVLIESVDNVYFVNDSRWLAGDWSHVVYTCANYYDVAVGKQDRLCLTSGNWSQREPRCAPVPKTGADVRVLSTWSVIIALLVVLVLFFIFTLVCMIRYIRSVKRDLVRSSRRQPVPTLRRKSSSRYATPSIYADFRSSVDFRSSDCYDWTAVNWYDDTQLTHLNVYNNVLNNANSSDNTNHCSNTNLNNNNNNNTNNRGLKMTNVDRDKNVDDSGYVPVTGGRFQEPEYLQIIN